jgi:DNA polymerase-3 subunit epsilon
MRLERKLTLGVLGLFLPPSAVAGLAVVLLHWHGVLQEPPALLAVGVLGLAVMMLCLGVVAHELGRSLVRTIQELRHGAELMATVNPEHRLDVRTGDELQALAAEINRLAEHLRTARQGLDERVAGATRELEAERGLLSAILGELAEGVVVANRDGRVTLANRAAGKLLHDSGAVLGRDLFELVDREVLVRHLAALRLEENGVERFTLRTTGGAVLQAAMTALSSCGNGTTSMILTLREPTHGRREAGPGPGGRPTERAGEAANQLHGVGLHSGTGAGVPGPTRSELYDFSLFDEMEPGLALAERERLLDGLAFVVFDTETTGLRPEAGDRVISIAGVRVRDGRVMRRDIFDALIDPGRAIPPESVKFHGITDSMVAGAPVMEVVLPVFLRFVGGAVLVGHEASFDLRFLEPEARRLDLSSLTRGRPILDTRLLSRALHGPGADHSLEAIALRLGVEVRGRHSALGDALTTAEIFVRLIALLKKRGVRTLGEALDAVRRARTPVI